MCQRPSQNSQASLDEVQRLGKMHCNPVHDPWHVVVHLVAVLEHHSVFAHEPTAASLSSQQPVKFAENKSIEKIATVIYLSDCCNFNFIIPSQAALLQLAVSDDDPVQPLPSLARPGILQVRVLVFVPHGVVQEEYSPHSLHWPLTVYYSK